MDMQNLSPEDLAQLIADAQAEYAARQAAQVQDTADAQAAITAAAGTLAGLLGPVDAVAGVDSIRAVRKYDDATLAEHAGLALNLAFTALEILTRASLDMAKVTGETL